MKEAYCCGRRFFGYVFVCVLLLLLAATMSGLTLGFMSINILDLEVLLKTGDADDRLKAGKILLVLQNRQMLLCTLLIWNSFAMELLPFFVDALLVPWWGSLLLAVTFVLLFAEIIPQATCSRHVLTLGSKLSWLVRIFIWICSLVTYPLSKLFDWLLGDALVLLGRSELKVLICMHGHEAGRGGDLRPAETGIIVGALELSQKTAKDAMTPIAETFSVNSSSLLDRDTMGLIISSGYSSVPIYSGSPTNIIGLILLRDLIVYCLEEVPINSVSVRQISRVYEDCPLFDVLNTFQKCKTTMAVVVKRFQNVEANVDEEVVGVITEKIIMEELLQGNMGKESNETGLDISC